MRLKAARPSPRETRNRDNMATARMTRVNFRAGTGSRSGPVRRAWIILVVGIVILSAPHAVRDAVAGSGQEDGVALPNVEQKFEQVPNQVQIEALIVEASSSAGLELNADSGYVRSEEGSGSVGQVTMRTSQVSPEEMVTVPMVGDGGAEVLPGLIANWAVVKGDWGSFYLQIRTMLKEGNAEIVSRPIVLVVEGTPAEIHAGSDVPYQTIDYKSPTTRALKVDWQPVGVRLQVTPTIEPPDRIKLDIEEVSVSSLVKYENIRGVDMPLFQTREESTIAYVRDGGTLVIGGVVADTTRISKTKVPLLGDIPLLGFLFRGTSTVHERTNLYIIMRPSIIRPGEPATLRDFEHLDEAIEKSKTLLNHAP